MRSQVRFAMHPQDEAEFLAEILRDPAVVFINGPRWKSEVPETHRRVDGFGQYCIIWSPQDLPALASEYIVTCDDWYCRSEFATIQFLRSGYHSESILIEGRIAVATTDKAKQYFDERSAKPVETRFKSLRKFIKKTYVNSVVRWLNTRIPEASSTPSRSANPSKPEASLWIGPAALNWLKSGPGRCIKQNPGSFVEARLIAEENG